MGGVSFLNDAASEMIYPLLPLFLTAVLGAGPAALGLIEGVAESSVSVFKLLSGYGSDRVRKRKVWMVVGYLASNAVRPLIALAQTWPTVLVLRFLDRIGKGLRTSPRDALITESMDGKSLGRAFGFHRGMDHAGAVVGPLIATGLLLLWPGNFRAVFLASIVPGFLTIGLLVFAVKETALTQAPDSLPFHPLAAWRAVPSAFKKFLLILLLFTLGCASDAFLLLKAKALGVPVKFLPLLWSFFHVVKVATAIPGGAISDRMGRRRLIIAGWLIYAAVYAAFAVATNAGMVWILFGVYGVFFGLTEGVERALVAELAPPSLRGSVFGLYHLTEGAGTFLASLFFGLIWQEWGDAAAFLTSATLALVSGVLLMRLKTEKPLRSDGECV